jgi:hypothetical protein
MKNDLSGGDVSLRKDLKRPEHLLNKTVGMTSGDTTDNQLILSGRESARLSQIWLLVLMQ